jgi:blocked-early-in-transport protein 1
MEGQNDEKIDLLQSQVGMLKSLSIAIGDEVVSQNEMLDTMSTSFTSTRDMLTSSVARIGSMLNVTSSRHMFILAGFIVFVMLLLYCMLRWKY